jgi:hypothetical protein
LFDGDHFHAELGGALGQRSQDALTVTLLKKLVPSD